jgi:hypothetical protein
MKFRGKTGILLLVLCFALAATCLAAGNDQGYMWNGTHWKDLSPDLKIAYVKGIGNMADFEAAADNTGSRAACISKAFVAELKTKTVGQVVKEVDSYYKENPGKMSTTVVEVIMRRCTKLCPPETAAVKKK